MDKVLYLIYRVFSGAIALLPLPLAFTLGKLFGFLGYWFAPPYRKLALNNLRIAFGNEKSPAEIRALAKQHFALLGANLFASFKLATMPAEAIAKHVQIENMEGLHKAAEAGKGVVVLLSHLGNWELLANVVKEGPPGRKVGSVYQPLNNRHFDKDVAEARARFGLVPFSRRDGFSKPIQFLRDGNVVCVFIDQHAGDGGVWTPFFGRLASTSPLAATMALRTGSAFVSAAIYTTGRAKWRLVISNELPRDTHDPNILTAEINLSLEREIRVAPADWFWVHNRWKTPKPEFLLIRYKRGVTLPPGFTVGQLKPFNILVRASNWLGDAVMSAPAVRAIKAGRPDARVTILTKAKLADFWRTLPEVDEIICIESGESIFSVARKISNRFDVAFVFPNSIRTGLEVQLAGIPRRIGYKRPWRGPAINAFVRDPKPGPITHQVHHYLAMARYAGAEIDFPAAPQQPIAQSGPIRLGLVPGAEYGPAKRWLPENFATVACNVSEKTGALWRIFGVAGDLSIANTIAASLEGQCENLAGKTTLAELIERLRECRLVLTNDTGTMHLAAHFGIPVVALFGSTEDRLTGPLGGNSHVVRHHAVCSPCFLRECPLDFRCMKTITVEEVTAKILQQLA
jgi:heptosyltransferase II